MAKKLPMWHVWVVFNDNQPMIMIPRRAKDEEAAIAPIAEKAAKHFEPGTYEISAVEAK